MDDEPSRALTGMSQASDFSQGSFGTDFDDDDFASDDDTDDTEAGRNDSAAAAKPAVVRVVGPDEIQQHETEAVMTVAAVIGYGPMVRACGPHPSVDTNPRAGVHPTRIHPTPAPSTALTCCCTRSCRTPGRCCTTAAGAPTRPTTFRSATTPRRSSPISASSLLATTSKALARSAGGRA